MRAARCLILLLWSALWAQDTVYVCPMDPDVRSSTPGSCARCGMKLVAGLPDPAAYHLDLKVSPRAVKPHQPIRFEFTVHDPWKDRPVTKFQIVHEKLFHMFVVGQDLEFFVHDHPVYHPDGRFTYDLEFPKPGMYRVLGDFYPDGATPQLIASTVIAAGPALSAVTPPRDYAAKDTKNLRVELVTVPPQPIAGMKTQVHFRIAPADGFEKYLGAWGHMLAASDDLIDMIHTHPFLADGGPEIQFNIVFPRARTYRVWVQFQRNGVVNTAHFDVPASELH